MGVPRGSSPPINYRSFITLCNDFLCLCAKSEPGFSPVPLYVLQWSLWQSSPGCTVHNHYYLQTVTSKTPPLKYEELGGEKGESVLSISIVLVFPNSRGKGV